MDGLPVRQQLDDAPDRERPTAIRADETPMSEYPTHEMPITYTAEQVAAMLNLSRRTIERATSDGLIPYRKTGTGRTSRRYTREDINVYLERQHVKAREQ